MKQKFECKRDNLIIRGVEYRKSEGKLPAIILSHGYLANQSMCKAYAELAAECGYAAFTFDFNGGGLMSKSSGKSVDMTVNTEVADLCAVIDYVKSLSEVDSSKITLLGCSQGGVVSAITAKKRRLEIKNLILLYPALCIPDDARKGKMMFAKFDPGNIPEIIQKKPMKLSGNYAKCVINWKLEDIVGGFEGPVLFLHGTSDKVVNISYAREAVKNYACVEYHEIEGGEHMFRGKHDEEAKGYIKTFIQKILWKRKKCMDKKTDMEKPKYDALTMSEENPIYRKFLKQKEVLFKKHEEMVLKRSHAKKSRESEVPSLEPMSEQDKKMLEEYIFLCFATRKYFKDCAIVFLVKIALGIIAVVLAFSSIEAKWLNNFQKNLIALPSLTFGIIEIPVSILLFFASLICVFNYSNYVTTRNSRLSMNIINFYNPETFKLTAVNWGTIIRRDKINYDERHRMRGW